MRRKSRIWAAALAFAMVALPGAAWAKPTPGELRRARANANAGRAAFERGDYETAIDRFNKAEQVIHALPHLLYVARAHTKLEQYFEARDVYVIMIQEELAEGAPKAFKKAQETAAAELKALDPHIPRLKVVLPKEAPATAKVQIDDDELTAEERKGTKVLRPGEHTIRVNADGFEPFFGVVNVPETGGVVPFEVTLKPKPAPQKPTPPPDDGPPVGPIVLMGVGGGLLVVGGVTGGLAIARTSELREVCPESPCSPEDEPLEDEATALSSVSIVSLVLGGLTVAGGATWLFVGPHNEAGSKPTTGVQVEPVFGPSYLGMRGRF